MRKRLGLVLAIAAGVLAAVALAVAVATLSFGRGDRICRGVTISGLRVGGLTREQAADAARAQARALLNRPVVLTAMEMRWSGTPWAFGARVKWREAVDRAFAVGREGSIIHRARCVLTSYDEGKQIGADVVIDSARTRAALAGVAKAVNRPHQDARMKVVGISLVVQQDVCGLKLDVEGSLRALVQAFRQGDAVIALPVVADQPEVTAEDAARITTLLGRFTTAFNPGKRGRTSNLRLAAGVIGGMILKPRQVFSVNDTVGPRLSGRGYKTAQIFVKGKLEEGIGGGVCQVSSTLYNAVLLAGLEVIERHPHSRTVPYVAAGRDATVAYGSRDFRFRNSLDSPVCIITKVTGARLTVDIYGAPEDRKSIQVYTGEPKRFGGGQETTVDRTLKPGERKVVDKGSSGCSVTVYRRVTDGDGSSITEVVSRDRYPPQKAVIAVGPEPAPAQAPARSTSQ